MHASQGDSDILLLEHVKELVGILDAIGIQPEGGNNEDEDIGMA